METDPALKSQISPLIANCLADAGMVGELCNQLKAYRPRVWSTWQGPWGFTLHKDVSHLLRAEMLKWDIPFDSINRELVSLCTDFVNLSNEELTNVGNASDGRFAYPVHRRRTHETTLVLQQAERNIDRFWGNF